MKTFLRTSLCLSFVVCSLVACSELSLDEITSDNIYEKLTDKGDLTALQLFGIDQFDGWRNYFYLPNLRKTNGVFIVDTTSSPEAHWKQISLQVRETGDYFKFYYVNNEIRTMEVYNENGLVNAEDAINFLIREKEYVYKKSDRINGVGQLIRKRDDKFYVCSVIKGQNSIPVSMLFRVLSKK